jgi:hypothetical protein
MALRYRSRRDWETWAGTVELRRAPIFRAFSSREELTGRDVILVHRLLVGETRRRHGWRGLHAQFSQGQAQAVLPRQILPAVSLAHRPGRERLAIHDLKVQHAPRRALDQRALGAGWLADVRGQLGPRPRQQAAFLRPPIDFRQHMWPAVWALVEAHSCGNADAKPPPPQALYYRCSL